jgi:trimethylamine--corrinoid protein Co-methyltransferase
VQVGDGHTVFVPAYGSPFVRDLDRGRRYGTIEDFRNLVKLACVSRHLHYSGGTICEPTDVPVNKRHLDMVYAHMRWSNKPFLGSITSEERARDSIDMCRILFGNDVVDNNCVVLGNVNVNSPLVFDGTVSRVMRTYAAAGQGVVICPFILGGAMGPVTPAACIAQAHAEAMVGVALTQLVRPGAPAVYGNFLTTMSLRTGAPTFGQPEASLAYLAVGQLARRLGVPLRCGGAFTASKICDAQAAQESADALWPALMAGTNFVLHAAGWLEGGLTVSLEKLILDADRLGMMAKLLDGLRTDDNAFALDAYRETAFGQHFLGAGHTLSNAHRAYYESAVADADSFEQWELNGSQSAEQRARDIWKKQLAEYEPPPLDEGVNEALETFIEKKRASMPDRWY